MEYVIGKAIRSRIVEKGMTFKSFSDKFGISDRNLQHIFQKTDLPITQIVRASEILDYDFIADYIKAKKPKYKILVPEEKGVNEPNGFYKSIPNDFTTMMFSLTIAGTQSQFEKFPELLQKTRKDAEDLGFKLV